MLVADVDKFLAERCDKYKYLADKADPTFDAQVRSVDLVKEFIIRNRLIIYGGTAIDYALRLQGDKIYDDALLQVPDFDFFSPKMVEHSYELADILYHAGYKDARAIGAAHMKTMRVDVGDNHFMADISYKPATVFETLPWLEYSEMRIIHPDFQRLDVHSSLSFPYDDAPREVIFARWAKDIRRFNKLAQHYPIKMPASTMPLRAITIPRQSLKYVLCGFAAYAAIYVDYVRAMKEAGADPAAPDVLPAEFVIGDDGVKFDTFDRRAEFVHIDIDKIGAHLTDVAKYAPYINAIPARLEGRYGEDVNVVAISTRNKLLAANTLIFGERHIRVVNVQFLLRHFLGLYFAHHATPRIAGTYLARYVSLLAMINAFCAAGAAMSSPLLPTVHTYGADNVSLSHELSLARLYNELDGTPAPVTPQNYYPERCIKSGRPHPQFDTEASVFFIEDGRRLNKDA